MESFAARKRAASSPSATRQVRVSAICWGQRPGEWLASTWRTIQDLLFVAMLTYRHRSNL
jgi:hypothetical protein